MYLSKKQPGDAARSVISPPHDLQALVWKTSVPGFLGLVLDLTESFGSCPSQRRLLGLPKTVRRVLHGSSGPEASLGWVPLVCRSHSGLSALRLPHSVTCLGLSDCVRAVTSPPVAKLGFLHVFPQPMMSLYFLPYIRAVCCLGSLACLR